MTNIVATVKKDSQFTEFKNVWTRLIKDFDPDSAVSECQALHNSRLSTKIRDNKGQFSPQMLIDASAIDLSTRSRMSYIAANLQLRLSKLESAIDAMDNLITSKYCPEFEIKTVDDKRKFVKRVLKSYVITFEKGKAALEFIEALIKDIDQAGFNLRNMVDCVKLLSETKGKII